MKKNSASFSLPSVFFSVGSILQWVSDVRWLKQQFQVNILSPQPPKEGKSYLFFFFFFGKIKLCLDLSTGFPFPLTGPSYIKCPFLKQALAGKIAISLKAVRLHPRLVFLELYDVMVEGCTTGPQKHDSVKKEKRVGGFPAISPAAAESPFMPGASGSAFEKSNAVGHREPRILGF